MKKHIEKTYGSALKKVMWAVNPIKKKIIKTYCLVHKFINNQAVEILEHDGYEAEYKYFKGYLENINDGVVWADQDFKSSNHFFHHKEETGLYGFSNALAVSLEYYSKAVTYFEQGNVPKSMFYLGATCHLIQDSNVPQHVMTKLLRNHRKFELWMIDEVFNNNSFRTISEIIKYDELEDFIKNNAKKSYETYNKYKMIENDEERFHKIASAIIPRAQSTTAGLLLKFYEEQIKVHPNK